MKITVLTHTAGHGAFAAIAENIAKGLASAGVDVDVLYLAGPPPEALPAAPDRVRMIRLGGRSRSCAVPVARYLRGARPDALICLGWVLNPAAVVAVAVARTRTPLILNEQSSLSYKARVEHRHEPRLRALEWIARVLYLRAAAVTGASSAIVADLEHEIGLDPARVRLKVVPNAVDNRAVVLRSLVPDERLVTEAGGPVFVNVARHARQKNLPLLLRAFRRYLTDGGTGTLVLVGSGPQSAELQRLVAELDLGASVVFRGRLLNPFPQMAAATAFVLSSEEEGFGLVLVEAMALGVPVVSTDCPGGPREILQDGAAGLLVPPADEHALADAMLRVTMDPELRGLVESGRRRAADFSPEIIGRRWLELVTDVSAATGARECI